MSVCVVFSLACPLFDARFLDLQQNYMQGSFPSAVTGFQLLQCVPLITAAIASRLAPLLCPTQLPCPSL